MVAKVYVLLDVLESNKDKVASTLTGRCGVTAVDILDGSPDIILKLEASNSRKLAKLTVAALTPVEDMIEKTEFLMTRGCHH